jgi:hypothetical protein
MRSQGLSIGYDSAAQDTDDEGNVKFPAHCSFAMNAEKVSVIAEIWDEQIKVDPYGCRVKIYALDPTSFDDFLSATSFSAHIAFDTPHELVMYEMLTKVIIPKGSRMRDRAKDLAQKLRQNVSGGAFAAAPSVVPIRAEDSSSKRQCTSSGSSSRSVANSTRSGVASTAAASLNAPDLPSVVHQTDFPVQFMPRAATASPSKAAGSSTSTSSHKRHRSQSRETVPAGAAAASPSKAAGRPPPSVNSDDSDSSDDEEQEQTGTWIGNPAEFDLVVCLDGDSAPLTAFLDKVKMRAFKDTKHPAGRSTIQEIINTNIWGVVALLKWAAGCSMLQSPNDKGKSHSILRSNLKGKRFQPSKAVPFQDCSFGLQKEHARIMDSDMTAARKRGFWRLLSNLPAAVAEAFRPRVLKPSWALCGYYPLSELMILDQCSTWRQHADNGGLTDAEKRLVIAALPALRDIADKTGRCDDDTMLEHLPFLARYPTDTNHALPDLAINRCRRHHPPPR